MNIFTTINVVEQLVGMFIQYEPALEKDVKDILNIIDTIRNKLAQIEGQH